MINWLIAQLFVGQVVAETQIQPIKELLVPKQLITEIEEDFFQSHQKANPKEERTKEVVLAFIPRKGIELKVSFTPLRGHALQKVFELRMPTLGGMIDLADFLRREVGTFLLKWELPDKFIEGNDYRVFFVPLYQKLPSEQGVECGAYFDLSSYFKSSILSSGLELTTASLGYIPVLAGAYVFSKATSEEVELGVVEFTDSRLAHRRCPTESKI